jgi:hypothetical protein
MAREDAQLGFFITLEDATKNMETEALAAGFYAPPIYGGKRLAKGFWHRKACPTEEHHTQDEPDGASRLQELPCEIYQRLLDATP